MILFWLCRRVVKFSFKLLVLKKYVHNQFSGLNCPISDEDMMQVNQGNKTNPNTAGILGNTGVDPLRKKSGCQDEDSINEVLYAAQVEY